MKGDFSRLLFKKLKHFAAVLSQQGRVLLDSEQNEAVAIEAYLRETSLTDIIGTSGVPLNDANAFKIGSVTAGDFTIQGGHMYVDGILVENDGTNLDNTPTTFNAQPYRRADGEAISPPSGGATRTDLVYLEVWQQHVTALEDPDIREKALNIPDTTTRQRTLWRVHLQQNVGNVDCDDSISNFPPLPTAVRLTNDISLTAPADDPCAIAPDGGFRLLENRLLRVEIHKGSDVAGGPTVKWSAENGAVAYGITSLVSLNIVAGGSPQPGLRLTLKQQARDQFLSLASNDLVEIVSGADEIRGYPGVLGRVHERISATVYDVLLSAGEVVPAHYLTPPLPQSLYIPDLTDFKVRRWDDLITNLSVASTLGNTGVSVTFSAVGLAHSGDYWVFAGRTANVASAAESLEKLTNAPPHGVQRHYARLALIQWNGTAATVVDCRPLFPPLTNMLQLHYVSGDGQEAMPGQPLQPLIVRVSNGGVPVPDAAVSFAPAASSGTVTPTSPIHTDANGLASVNWTLNPTTYRQQVTASLVVNPNRKVVFNANLSIASQVAYDPAKCSNLAGISTVQDALDKLCQQHGSSCCITVGQGGDYEKLDDALNDLLARRERDICICLLHGDHILARVDILREFGEPDLHIKIEGCGSGSRIVLTAPVRLQNVKAFILRDVALMIDSDFGSQRALEFTDCAEVTLTSCQISGYSKTTEGALLWINNVGQLRLQNNVLEAALMTSLQRPKQVFESVAQELPDLGILVSLYSLPEQNRLKWDDFRQIALDAVEILAQFNADQSKAFSNVLQKALSSSKNLTVIEHDSYDNLDLALAVPKRNPLELLEMLFSIRRAAIKVQPGTALILSPTFQNPPKTGEFRRFDKDVNYLVEDNEIIGIMSLYERPALPADVNKILTKELIDRLHALFKEKMSLNSNLGTLQMRGNRLLRVTVAQTTLAQLAALVDSPANDNPGYRILGHCLFTDNIIEGSANLLVCGHLGMTGNEFTLITRLFNLDLNVKSYRIGFTIEDVATFVGNRVAGLLAVSLIDVARRSERIANPELTFLDNIP